MLGITHAHLDITLAIQTIHYSSILFPELEQELMVRAEQGCPEITQTHGNDDSDLTCLASHRSGSTHDFWWVIHMGSGLVLSP